MSENIGGGTVGITVEDAGLNKYEKHLGKINKLMRDQAKAIKNTNEITSKATATMHTYDEAGQKIQSTFKLTAKYAKILSTSFTQMTATQKRNSEAFAVQRAEEQAYNTVTKQAIVVDKAHAVAVQGVTAALKNQEKTMTVGEIAARTEQKRRLLSAEKQHAIAIQMNTRFTEKQAKIAAAAAAKQERAMIKARRNAQMMIKSNGDLVLSMKGLVRILDILLIRRGLHLLVTKMRESIDTIQDFHKALTEIQTIAQDSQVSLDGWAESIVKISNAWDLDLIDAANARYEILSNQIAKGRIQTEMFSDAAAEFAKITRSSVEDSVNLLTAALNAYGKTAYEVTDVSAKLFKTIELGRIRSKDLANTMGRVLVPASQLGIDLEEVAAMMALITIKGVKATESMTLLRGVMMKLMKPTSAMEELFAKWGVRTGEQAIATYGLAGVMKLLEEATRGSGSEIANLFGRIRATMGVTAVVADLERFNEILGEIRDTSAQSFAQAAGMQFQTAGEQISKEFNRLQNYFTQSFGGTIIELLATYNKNIASITETVAFLIDRFATLGFIMLGIWATKKLITFIHFMQDGRIALALMSAGMKSATVQAQALAFALSMKTLGITVAIYAAAEGLSYLIKQEIKATKAINEFKDAYETFARSQESALEKQRTEYEKTVESFRKGVQSLLLEYAKLNQLIGDAGAKIAEKIELDEKWIKDHQALIEKDAKNTLEVYEKMYDALIKQSEEYEKKRAKLIDERAKSEEDFAKKIEDITRKYMKPKDVLKRIEEQYAAQKNITAEQKKGSEEQRKSLEKELELAEALYDLEVDLAESRKKDAIEKQKQADKLFGRKGKKYSTDTGGTGKEPDYATAFKEDLERINSEMDNSFGTAVDQLKEYYDIALELAKQVKSEYRDIADIINEMMKRLGKDAVDELGGKDALSKKIIGMIEKGAALELLPSAELTQQINKFNTIFDKIAPIKVVGEGLTKFSTTLEENTKALMRVADEYSKQLAAYKSTGDAASSTMKETIPLLASEFEKVIMQMDRMYAPFFSSMKEGLANVDTVASFKAFTEAFVKAAAIEEGKTKLTQEEQLAYIDSLTKFTEYSKTLMEKMETSGAFRPEDAAEMQKGANYLNDIINTLSKSAATMLDVEDKRESIQEKLDGVTAQLAEWEDLIKSYRGWSEEFIADIGNVSAVNLKFVAETLVAFGSGIAGVTAIMDTLLREAKANPVYVNPELKAAGGSVWGTDTVPTRLTPGEFVVNQRATRQFYGQLLSMNNGGASPGGDYSVTVGDMSINVQGGQTEHQSVQNIMAGLRRGIARGQLGGLR